MKFFYLFGATLLSTFLNAQSNLSVFNNSGQPFYVVLNGIRQNSKPETNVQVSQIKNGSYAVKVIFADGKTPDIDKNFMIDAPYDITTRIVFKKGKGKLQLMGMEPTHGVIQEAVVYRPNDAANYSDAVVNMNVNVSETTPASVQTSNSTNSNTTTTTTTTTTNGTIPDENVNLNMNLSVGGVNLNLNANANGSGLGTSATVTETTTSTISTSSTTTTSSNSVSTNTGMNQTTNNMSNQVNANIQMNGNSQLQPVDHSSRVNCTKTMNRLEAFKTELQDQSFEEDRLEALKLAMKTTCLTTAQAEQLLDLFTFDENRLEVAKYLADRLTDRDNAGALAKKLTFDSNKMEYRRYISE
ncbi:MAG: DUF4476 domain-containing protein [Sphingomonadales bacterium]